jgi:threonyl-tRNA synthetase
MLHRAIVGSMERFIGILIEHYAGAFRWLAPVQVVVMNITANQATYAAQVLDLLKGAGLRAESDGGMRK